MPPPTKHALGRKDHRAHPEQYGPEVQLVVFQLGDEEFGFPVATVKEINRLLPITRIPRSPHFLEGVINLRGQITAVMDLRKRFHMPDRPRDDDTRIIVLQVDELLVGLIVDKVHEVRRIPEASIAPPPPVILAEMDRHYLTGVGKLDDRLIIILDAQGLLSKREVELVDQLEHSGAAPTVH